MRYIEILEVTHEELEREFVHNRADATWTLKNGRVFKRHGNWSIMVLLLEQVKPEPEFLSDPN